MNVSSVARLVGTSPDSLRRWCEEYAAFLSPSAVPPKGTERDFNTHDIRILNYIGAQRKAHALHDEIREQLVTMQRDGWAGLPPMPEEWQDGPADGRIAVSEAAQHSQHLAEIAAQGIVIAQLREALQDATGRAERAERELSHLQASERATAGEKHELALELERARGEVATLQARLSAYALTGDRPLPLAVIILVTALAVAAVVVVLLVVVRLVLG
jgi:DNA-binding transcriptional MerR regulator